MPKAYSGDLRVRVIEMVRAGASRREAAEVFSVAGSTAVKWLQRWEKSGSAEAKPRGGSVSPLEVHAMVILEVVRAQPDATFVELLVVLKKRGIRTSRSALWRFFGRHDITFKKKSLCASERQHPTIVCHQEFDGKERLKAGGGYVLADMLCQFRVRAAPVPQTTDRRGHRS